MTQRLNALFVFLFSLLVIASAWGFELIGGFEPCGLCLQQRVPYYAGVPLAAIAFFVVLKAMPDKLIRLIFALLAVVFAISLFLAVRHAGVEWGWWLGPANCGAGGGFTGLSDGNSLLEAVQNTNVVFCDQPAGRILGLSFAGWNALASILLVLAALRGALKSGQSRQA